MRAFLILASLLVISCVSCKVVPHGSAALFRKTITIPSGNTPIEMEVTELERHERYSLVRVQRISGKPTGSALALASVFCELGRARRAAYICKLHDWADGDRSSLYVVGFAPSETVDPRVYFGYAGDIVDEPVFLSVSAFEIIETK
jgi:hypothetical protein